MGKKLYVGNLPYSTTENDLATLFNEAGSVASVTIISDRYSGRSKGFGFVEMASDDEAKKAIETLNGRQISGRDLVVNEARPLEERKSNGGGGGGFNKGNGGGGRRSYGGGGGGDRDSRRGGFNR